MGEAGRKPARLKPLNNQEKVVMEEFTPERLRKMARAIIFDALGEDDEGNKIQVTPQKQMNARKDIMDFIKRSEVEEDEAGGRSASEVVKELLDAVSDLVDKTKDGGNGIDEPPDLFSQEAMRLIKEGDQKLLARVVETCG